MTSVDSVEVTALCSDNREAYFSTVLNELHACVSYDQLREACLKLDNCLYGSLSVLPLAAFTSRNRIASELIPDDVNATTASLTPMVVCVSARPKSSLAKLAKLNIFV